MDICRIYRIFIILIFIAAASFLQATELDDIYAAILLEYDSVKLYEADFKQENYWKGMDFSKISWGKIYFDVDNFLMKYDEPEGQLLFIRDEIITMYDAASNQAVISNNMDVELRPVSLISEYWQNSEKTLLMNETGLIKISLLTPARNQILLVLKNFLLIELQIIDEDENSVQYKFSNSKINQPLPVGIFEIKLPEDANIINNTN